MRECENNIYTTSVWYIISSLHFKGPFVSYSTSNPTKIMLCILCSDHSSSDAVQLACGHSFCRDHLQNSRNCLTCLRRVSVSHATSDRTDSRPKCGGCHAKPGCVYCATCFSHYCVGCDAFYHSKVFAKSHHTRSLLTSHESDITSHSQLQCTCHLKPLLFFCTECGMRV